MKGILAPFWLPSSRESKPSLRGEWPALERYLGDSRWYFSELDPTIAPFELSNVFFNWVLSWTCYDTFHGKFSVES